MTPAFTAEAGDVVTPKQRISIHLHIPSVAFVAGM